MFSMEEERGENAGMKKAMLEVSKHQIDSATFSSNVQMDLSIRYIDDSLHI